MKTYFFPILLLSILQFSCTNKGEKKTDSNLKIIAKAGNTELNEDDYRGILVGNGLAKDSVLNAKKTLEKWATESLFYQEALEKLDKEDVDIEQQVEAYRQELVNHIYSTRLIEANLDTSISLPEIEAYYNEHRDNFILKENIVKVNYIKVPVKAQGIDKIKRIVSAGIGPDISPLKALCAQYAENYFINDSTWIYTDEIKKEIPGLKEEPDFNMVTGRVVQFTDEYYYYYLKIKDVKVKNSLSPINFEKQNIKKFILNNRKAQLIIQYKQLLLEKAKANKKFQVL